MMSHLRIGFFCADFLFFAPDRKLPRLTESLFEYGCRPLNWKTAYAGAAAAGAFAGSLWDLVELGITARSKPSAT